MRRFVSFLLFYSLLTSVPFAQFSGFGVHFDYEGAADGAFSLRQELRKSGFKESCDVTFNDFKRMRLGLAWLGVIPGPLLELDSWGLELGVGLNYHAGDLVRYQSGYNVLEPSQVFDYYQMGSALRVKSFGLSLHGDIGGVFYIGGDVDAGISRLTTSSASASERVKDWGGYVIPKFQGGLCIPILGGMAGTYTKIYLKIYGDNSFVFYRFNKVDWESPDREYKNFSNLRSHGFVRSVGFSLSCFLSE